MPRLSLVVLRARDASALASFYSALGLEFVRHRHGDGPEHYAFDDGAGVFEIYPANSSGPTKSIRLGFAVPDVPRCVELAVAAGGTLVKQPAISPWGLRAVVLDVEGHRVELTQPCLANAEV